MRGIEIRAGADLEASIGSLHDRMDAIEKMLTRPNIDVKVLPASVPLAASGGPVLLDWGAAPDGRIWDVDLVSLFFSDPWTSANGPLVGASGYGTVTTPAANQAIVTVGQPGSGALWPPGNYQVTVGAWYGGTAGAADDMKLVMPSVTTISTLFVPPTVNGSPVLRTFTLKTNAGATFSVQAIAGGAGVYKATLDVVPLAAGVSAAIFVGQPPINPAVFNPMDCVAPGIAVPSSNSFATRRPIVRNKNHLYALISGSGLSALTGTLFGTCSVSIVPDTSEAMAWL